MRLHTSRQHHAARPFFQQHSPRLPARQLRAALFAGLLATLLTGAAWAQRPAAAPVLPPEVDALLARAKVPREALTAVVVDASGRAQPLLSFQPTVPMNPASVMKLVTTYAGLELLGPSYTWNTPVYIDGTISGGVLQGNLVIQGRGDPKLMVERLWLLLRRVRGLGITTISGDILLDRSAFAATARHPAEFDGEPLRPYNVAPDALLLNYKTVAMSFVPDPARGVASVSYEPAMANVQMPATVPLLAPPVGSSPQGAALADCGDYRSTLKPDFNDAYRITFAGGYPPACGEKTWSVAYIDPASYAERAVQGVWQDLGGKLGGRVREGSAPAALRPAFESVSPTLTEVIRDINKFSNNVMAQQLFLTLSLAPGVARNPARPVPASFEASQAIVRTWWRERLGEDVPVLENGSGLSRVERVSAQGLSRLLQTAYVSGVMPELMSSLPITGVDGTLRRSKSQVSQGWAHLKTGTLRDSTALAGYVHTAGGRRLVVVGIINHPNAPAARPALEALVDWAVKEGNR
ncbi:MAG: D-alanyl-D-alanine carboxypeptidase/D-alanyl-D-alanine-endopeptidase [Polaromonas sp.]|nr:D-alanyl-D-alanine carboxypeptidase/D-alanyl-D-alanine-endopeptidase [Polaromonas sp.]